MLLQALYNLHPALPGASHCAAIAAEGEAIWRKLTEYGMHTKMGPFNVKYMTKRECVADYVQLARVKKAV